MENVKAFGKTIGVKEKEDLVTVPDNVYMAELVGHDFNVRMRLASRFLKLVGRFRNRRQTRPFGHCNRGCVMLSPGTVPDEAETNG